jgi:hypothetical protein
MRQIGTPELVYIAIWIGFLIVARIVLVNPILARLDRLLAK